MKTQHFLLLLLAGCMFSCNDKEDADRFNYESEIPQTFAKFVIDPSKAFTKGAPAGAQTPSPEEEKILNASIFLFDPGNTLAYKEEMDADGTIVMEVKAQQYSIYAVANMDDLKAYSSTFVAGSTSLDNFLKEVIELTEIEDLTVADGTEGFVMTSFDPVTTRFSAILTEEEARNNTGNGVTVNIGRAVAKVALDYDPAIITATLGGLENVQFKVCNNPQKMYYMPGKQNSHWNTPYFNGLGITSPDDFFDNTPYKTAGTSSTVPANQCDDFDYAVENSQGNPRVGYNTFTMITGKFTPNEWLDPDGTPGNASDDGTFYRIANVDNPALADDAWTILSYEPGIYNDDAITGLEENQKVITYEQGTSYYGMHLLDASQTDDIDKYAVRRNSFYWITITSVSGPGASQEYGNKGVYPDPEVPIVLVDTWIKGTMEVSDWDMINQSGEI